MSVLVHFSSEISYLGIAPYYDSGLMLENKTYWRITSVLGRVLGAATGARACLNWVGPCPIVIKGANRFKPQWIKVDTRQIPISDLASFDADLDEAEEAVPEIGDDASPEGIDQILEMFERPSNWVAPTPPEPLKYQIKRARFEVVGIELEKIHRLPITSILDPEISHTKQQFS